MRSRILFFDLIRIAAVWLIVASHVGMIANHYIKIENLYYPSWGGVGVTFLLFVSGAVLEYNYKSITSFSEYGSFLLKRFERIYPAYWISLAIALSMSSVGAVQLLEKGNVLLQISGFMAFTNQWGGEINAVVWFIGLIMSLYAMFPLLSAICRKNSCLFFLGALAISTTFRYYFIINHIGLRPEDWFPLCRIFEFGLGIYAVQHRLYPKWTYSSRQFYVFAEMSFYIFLVHFPIIYLWKINNLVFLVCTLFLSFGLFKVDSYIQKSIKNVAGESSAQSPASKPT